MMDNAKYRHLTHQCFSLVNVATFRASSYYNIIDYVFDIYVIFQYHPLWTHLCVRSDIDECVRKTSGCQHNCSNNIGSFTCFCYTGYRLNTDKRTCSGNYLIVCWVSTNCREGFVTASVTDTVREQRYDTVGCLYSWTLYARNNRLFEFFIGPNVGWRVWWLLKPYKHDRIGCANGWIAAFHRV